MATDTHLISQARRLLQDNDRDGVTVPSPELYPHQWNWDSAFAAMGWSTFDAPRAMLELERLLGCAWTDGMVPHIIFDPAVEGYEPGPRWWKTADHPAAPGRPTSSLTQPPVAATALRRVLLRYEGDSALRNRAAALVGPLDAWHRWFLQTRDPLHHGLPCIIHPWESGMDNAPRWDAALARVEGGVTFSRRDNQVVPRDQRPVEEHYARYARLVQLNAGRRFAPPRMEDWPFLVQDVVLAAILLQAERDLHALGQVLGMSTGAGQRAERLEAAITDRMYDGRTGLFADRDVLKDQPGRADTLASFLPLYAGLGGARTLDALAEALDDADRLGTAHAVPTVFANSPDFDPRRYWRGPCWVNTNWMLIQGAGRAGREDLAERLQERTLELVRRSGYREYYEPHTGEGLGGQRFSWSAALVLDLLDH